MLTNPVYGGAYAYGKTEQVSRYAHGEARQGYRRKPRASTVRVLRVPAVRDRVVQQVVLGVLEPIFEANFSPHSHGFRPGRDTFSALRELYGHVRTGHIYLVDVDIAKFFDTIPHEPLIDAVAERVADGSVLRLIRLFLEALIQDGYRLVRPRAGTPQGSWRTSTWRGWTERWTLKG